MITCNNCKTENIDEAIYCSSCGSKLDNANELEHPTQKTEIISEQELGKKSDKLKNNIPYRLIIIAFIIVFSVTIFLLNIFPGSKSIDDKTAENSSNYNKSYENSKFDKTIKEILKREELHARHWGEVKEYVYKLLDEVEVDKATIESTGEWLELSEASDVDELIVAGFTVKLVDALTKANLSPKETYEYYMYGYKKIEPDYRGKYDVFFSLIHNYRRSFPACNFSSITEYIDFIVKYQPQDAFEAEYYCK